MSDEQPPCYLCILRMPHEPGLHDVMRDAWEDEQSEDRQESFENKVDKSEAMP